MLPRPHLLAALLILVSLAAPTLSFAQALPHAVLRSPVKSLVGMPWAQGIEPVPLGLLARPSPLATSALRDFRLPAPRRPSAMVPFYVSFAALQGLDVLTTFRALDRGSREANPVMGRLVENRALFVAVKGGMTLTTVLAAETLWKRNRVAAVALMAAVNGAYALVVAHNYRAAR